VTVTTVGPSVVELSDSVLDLEVVVEVSSARAMAARKARVIVCHLIVPYMKID
jgi:hypothetical protein